MSHPFEHFRFRSTARMYSQRPHAASRRATADDFRGLDPLETRILCSTTIPWLPFSLPTNIGSLLNGIPGVSKPSLSDQWWLKNSGQTLSTHVMGPATGTPGADVDALDAWNITTGSSNVVIAVLDTGFDLSNPDLSSVLWTNPREIPGDGIDNDGNGKIDDVHGWNFLNNSNNVTDNFVHGTAVAAAIHSVAPGVTILPVEIGTAAGASDQDVINGINYLIKLKKAGVNIVAINASYISTSATLVSQVNAIKAAGNAGMLYVAAAGNLGMNLDSLFPSFSIFGRTINTASYLPSNLMFVAATDNQDHLWSLSDYGAKTVAVGAPGVDMTLAMPGGLYAPLSGTSFAAPMVSAIAGLIASKYPKATMAKIKTAILNSGDLDPSLAGKTITGRRVNAYNALQYMAGNKTPTPAPTPTPSPTPPPTTPPTDIITKIKDIISKWF